MKVQKHSFYKCLYEVIIMEILKVRDRGDGVKQVTIPKASDIEPGDYVKINKVEEE